jgi:ACR3 family arsenite efflux pump ArsB
MWKILKVLKDHLIYSIPVFMILGFLAGLYFDPSILKRSIIFLTFLMVFPMMVNIDIKKLFSHGDNRLVFSAQLMNFFVVPLLAFLIGKVFFSDNPMMIMGMLLIGLVPTSGMSISWTGFSGGNINGAVKIQITGLILASLLTPFYIQLLLGSSIEVPMAGLFLQILSIVIFPLVLGILTRSFLVKSLGQNTYDKKIKNKFPLISTAGLFLMIFAAMALKAKAIFSAPESLVILILPLLLFYVLSFALSTLIGRRFFSEYDLPPFVFGTSIRNLSIVLAIAMNVFGKNGSDMALLISVAYIFQVEIAAIYVKFSNRRIPLELQSGLSVKGLS